MFRETGYTPPEAQEKFKQQQTSFISSQMDLPREQWDPRFLEYIEQKRAETAQLDDNPKAEQKRSVDRYTKGFKLSVDDLKDKKIIDLGVAEGHFVKEVLNRGITKDIVGVDLKFDDEDRKGFEDHLVEANFADRLPGDDYDLALAFASMDAPLDDEEAKVVQAMVENVLRSLKKGGELRVFPIPKTYPESGLAGVEAQTKHWNEILDHLAQQGFQTELLPVDLHASPDQDDVWLNQVAVIKK